MFCLLITPMVTFKRTHVNNTVIMHTNVGFYLTDIIECNTNNGGCSQQCSNSAGSFLCSCSSGYSLNGDGFTCDGKFTAWSNC